MARKRKIQSKFRKRGAYESPDINLKVKDVIILFPCFVRLCPCYIPSHVVISESIGRMNMIDIICRTIGIPPFCFSFCRMKCSGVLNGAVGLQLGPAPAFLFFFLLWFSSVKTKDMYVCIIRWDGNYSTGWNDSS